ncbi:putative phosphotransferase [Paenibacillus larvae subsp. larvae]|uniref:Putative pyruvate, phosphate dikinase regulatory protein n=3 Tax=Paenibacillus larvae TaxID=1464 RepID=V9W9I6_9BACL|nr:pyruvate, water dikinase regulatory protein [Paenibacillus larvae]AHD05762.1 putative phosphotransferase [Paenibacillus larvae subsp. larvae DSM 25430]AQT83509.1 phosphoenolpyruvate synthase regulatory protein [Paenibacillus larvae subsp. pulvifaciens]AQZ48615.1 phosphoenolpyruvate synthase regulatory protein [Paenibacillus larvae subsp. pulvifaciens]ARF70069.1 phosphoenolpyruvate synthase regulatory protein [Paenibacillus larvae subsp. pulvifaciens]AVF26686.1 putative phosphotransferase [P
MSDTGHQLLYLCSDSIGETAEAVALATIRQFRSDHIRIKRYSYVRHEDEIRKLMEEVAESRGFVAYTLVQPELREMMKAESIRLTVRAVDIMGPMMKAFMDTFGDLPIQKPGLLHQMDEEYFRRVEAIEFAVKYDDGKDTRGMLLADIVLIGVSRTSKTPLSIFLAHKGVKVANLPVMPEVKPPQELFKIPGSRIIGLTMDAENILKIRTERLKTVGLPFGSKYASMQRILEELEYADRLMKSIGCPVINVTDKAIEETAGLIMGYV